MDAAKTTPRPDVDGPGAIALLSVAVLQLGVSFMGLRTLLGESITADPSRVVLLIISLSAVVIGVVFAGAVCGLLTASSTQGPLARLPRVVRAAVGGVGLGVIAAGAGYLAFTATPTIGMIIAGVAGVSGVIGGLSGAPARGVVVAAGLIGTAILLVFQFLRGWFMTDLLDVLTRTPDTFRWIGIIGGVIAGMCAGFAGYLYLRRRGHGVALFGYMLAGAFPGLVWLVSEISTRIGGTILLAYAGEPGLADGLYLGQTADAQLNGSLATLFAGATTAVLAFGLLSDGKAAQHGGSSGQKASSKKNTRAKNNPPTAVKPRDGQRRPASKSTAKRSTS